MKYERSGWERGVEGSAASDYIPYRAMRDDAVAGDLVCRTIHDAMRPQIPVGQCYHY